MNAALPRHMTREEFFGWAAGKPGRYEFDGHEPVIVTGGTNNHGLIADNLRYHLRRFLGSGPHRVMGSDGGGIAIPGDKVRYPEAVVTASALPGRAHLIPDPLIVFEVVSPTSVHTDHVHKLREYHAVPTIRRYVVIEQDGIALAVHTRQGPEPWTTIPLLEGDTLDLPEIGVSLPLALLYQDVTFDLPATE